MRRLIFSGLAILGATLMALTLLGGLGIHAGVHSNPPREGEAFDPVLAEKTRSLSALEAAVRKMPDGGDFESLAPQPRLLRTFDVVATRFTRAKELIRHTPFTNWIMWSLGLASRNAAVIRDPELLLRYTDSAYCGETAYVMLRLAEKFGIPTRHVGLYGHVVMEAWYDEAWHLFDPYAEVVPMRDGRILSIAELTADKDLVRAVYVRDQGLARVFLDTVRANFIAYPPGAQFVWKADLLVWIERLAEWLKYLLPAAFIGIGLWGLFRQGRRGGISP